MNRFNNLIIRLISSLLLLLLIFINCIVFNRLVFILTYLKNNNSIISNLNENIDIDKVINNLISRLNNKEKIGQLILINYYGDDLEKIKILLEQYNLTGLMLRSENFKNKNYNEIKNINQKIIKFSSKIPCFIAIDQEGGNVSRLSGIIKNYPNPYDLYQTKGKEGIKELAEYFGEKLKDLKITINFAPVIDVILNTNSIVYKRSFSSNPIVNAELAKLYIEVFNKFNLVAAPKHYPGYGNVSPDPHFEICIDNQSDINEIALPFFKLNDSDIIMSSHVIFSKYDDKPATLSEKIISLIREKNYSNIIITDDIQMKSITKIYDYREAAVMAINAGCDIILCVSLGPSDWYKNAIDLHEYLLNAYNNGSLKKENVNKSLQRILKLKLKLYQNEQWCLLTQEEKNLIMNNYFMLTKLLNSNKNILY